MESCIIIRGPAGVGKTTIAKRLSRDLNADYFSFDAIMEEKKLDTIIGDGIPSENFVKANDIIIPMIMQKKRVVLDGCFYRKEQISHLLNKLKTKVDIFTLDASIGECLKRNQTRKKPMTEDSIKQVHNLVSKIKIGITINTSAKSIKQIVAEILKNEFRTISKSN